MLRAELPKPKLARIIHLAERVLRLLAGEEARASASVIHPRSPAGKLCNEDRARPRSL
jgi:hypothetical protein